jgi:hypothetical protein
MPVPDFSPGEILTAAAMDSIGLWLVKTQTIGTTVSTVTVSDAFSANFNNYRIVISGPSFSTLCGIRIQLSASTGNTYSTANQNISYTSASTTVEVSANTAFWSIGTGQGVTSVAFDIINPFATSSSQQWAQSAGETFVSWRSGYNSSTASSTGFTLSMTGGTVTGGTIRVYGYRN